MVKFDYVTLTTGDADYIEICEWLKEMSKKHERLTFVNFFLEMPVGSKTTITASDNDTFIFSPSETHIKVLSEKLKTFIKVSSELWILANCQAIDTRAGEVVLAGFRYVNLYADSRKSFRVRLLKPINVSLEAENRKMTGVLKDISIGGCRVSMFMKNLVPGTRINLQLKMFDFNTNTILSMSVVAVLLRLDISKMPVICNFTFELDSATEDKLINFINQRQIEVMKTLKDSLI